MYFFEGSEKCAPKDVLICIANEVGKSLRILMWRCDEQVWQKKEKKNSKIRAKLKKKIKIKLGYDVSILIDCHKKFFFYFFSKLL